MFWGRIMMVHTKIAEPKSPVPINCHSRQDGTLEIPKEGSVLLA